MSHSSETTRSAAQVRSHFRRAARSFDSLYDEDGLLQRKLRPGLRTRRDVALGVVDSYAGPRVLDVGCGSGRIAENVLEHGASAYVGIDFSEPMLDLARERLQRFEEKVELVCGDFRDAPLDGKFEVVLGLGLFDYLPDATPFAQRMGELCSGAVVASFPGWSWFKGPIRKARYELVNKVPIFDYTEDGVRRMFLGAGFTRVEFVRPGRSGFIARAYVAPPLGP
jgi:SAM-dependent methyltransferase